MNAFDGSKREVYAMGARNPVGLNFSPEGNFGGLIIRLTDSETISLQVN